MVFAVGVLGFGVYSGVRSRREADTELKQATAEAAVAAVNVVSPTLAEPTQEILLPGTTQAYTDASLFARTNGYVKAWYFDIGARVKKDQLLAEIETPEVDQQLQQARADLETAQANLRQAEITAQRWQSLLESGSVSTQETDQAVNGAAAMKGTVSSNAANVRRLEKLQSFEKIVAPFDGVITARNLDIGVLVNAGSTTTPSQELFHMAAIDKLRVFVAVPEVYAPAARPGAQATLTLDAFPGRTFRGTLVRTANAIDLTARTLLVEVDVDNPMGELLPGAYAFVHLHLPKDARSVTIPVNALIFRSQGLEVAVVRDGQAKLVPITIGRDHGNFVEVVKGLEPSDQVILAPSDSLTSGTPVRIAGTPKAARP
ncbi:MAG: efflux transporter periplasmic adaptor subunit [Candidatus Rokuibacteriota bacterium]|nr:MAG: efflux transporter periplasmic adaptor subunit [Candidatus Rokubacteria bacterium]